MKPLPCRRCGTSGLVQKVTKTEPIGGGSSYPVEWKYIDCPDCKGAGEFTFQKDIQKWLMIYHCGDVMDQHIYESLKSGIGISYRYTEERNDNS